MPAPTIVFDLDGTLIDTAPDLVDTMNLIFAREGFAPLPYEQRTEFCWRRRPGDDRARL